MCNNLVKVSVIMPSLNVGAYIAECIESAINQTLKDIEIICVDAGSTDGTLEILREYEKKDNRVKVIVSDVKSYGRQLNLGFEIATGKYMAILETDDVIKPEMYEVLYNEAVRTGADIVKSDYEYFIDEENGRKTYYISQLKENTNYNQAFTPLKNIVAFTDNSPSTWSSIYKTSFLQEKNIKHNESLGAAYQDTSFWFLTLVHAEKILFLDKAFYMLRRDRNESSVFNKGKIYSVFDEYRFIEENITKEIRENENFIKVFWKKKYDHYMYHYRRIADEYKIFFLCKMAEEFKIAFESNQIDRTLFQSEQMNRLEELVYYPEQFNARSSHHFYYKLNQEHKKITQENKKLTQEIIKLRKEIDAIKHSRTYKVGCIVAFIPKKIYRGVKCFKENGVKYTIKRIWFKIIGKAN